MEVLLLEVGVCCGAVGLPSLNLTLLVLYYSVFMGGSFGFHGVLLRRAWKGEIQSIVICCADPCGVQITWFLACGKGSTCQFNIPVFACHNS